MTFDFILDLEVRTGSCLLILAILIGFRDCPHSLQENIKCALKLGHDRVLP
jgi:hypothetical protein